MGIVELLRLTGFRTYGEFVQETTPIERKLIAESIREWHEAQEGMDKSGGVGGGGPSMGL